MRQVRLDRTQPAQYGALVKRPRRLDGEAGALGVDTAEAPPHIEVVDRRQRAVHRRRRGLGHGLQVRPVVADGPVSGGGVGQGVTIDHGRAQPVQVLADLGQVGATGLRAQRRAGELGLVLLEELAARTLALPDAQSVEDLTALLTSAGER